MSAHHGPEREHERLKHRIASAKKAGNPVVVVVEFISGYNLPHFLRELVQRYNLAKLREIMLPAAARDRHGSLAAAPRAQGQRTLRLQS